MPYCACWPSRPGKTPGLRHGIRKTLRARIGRTLPPTFLATAVLMQRKARKHGPARRGSFWPRAGPTRRSPISRACSESPLPAPRKRDTAVCTPIIWRRADRRPPRPSPPPLRKNDDSRTRPQASQSEYAVKASAKKCRSHCKLYFTQTAHCLSVSLKSISVPSPRETTLCRPLPPSLVQ